MESAKSASQNHGRAQQFITAVILNLASMSFGIMCGWTSPVAPQLRSSQPPVGETAFSEDQISWITSMGAIGSLLATLLCSELSERIGRKYFAVLTGLQHIGSWLLVAFAQSYEQLIAARFAGGVAIAMTLFIVPLYMSEMASEDVRGFLGSLLPFAINLGILFAYVAGALLPYRTFAGLCLVLPLGFMLAILFVPETPAYLVRRNRQLRAHKSLMFFRGGNRELVERELSSLRSETKLPEDSSRTVGLAELFADRATRKGLLISLGLVAAQPLCGIQAMTMYAETIFSFAGSSLSAELASIIIAVMQIGSSQVSSLLMERAGRRLLGLVSSAGMTLSLSVVAAFFYLQRNHYDLRCISWLPLVALSAYIVSFCLGIGPVPFVIVSEVFKLHFTSLATATSFVCFFVVSFIAVRLFNLVLELRGPDGCFFMFAVFSALIFAFCYYLLLETKGRRRQDIVDELAGIDPSSRNAEADVDQITLTKLLPNTESR